MGFVKTTYLILSLLFCFVPYMESHGWVATRMRKAKQVSTVQFSAVPLFVQVEENEGASTTSVARAFSSGNSAGNLIVAVCYSNSTTATLSASDSRGNSYTSAQSQTRTGFGKVEMFYAQNIAAGANTVTCSSSASGTIKLQIAEYKNVATTGAFEVANSASGNSASPTVSLTPSSAKSLVVGSIMFNTNSIGGTPYSFVERTDGFTGGLLDRIAHTITSFTLSQSLNTSQNWVAITASFKWNGATESPRPALMVAGGQGNSSNSVGNVLKSYDNGLTWHHVSDLPATRLDACLFYLDGTLWVAGGRNTSFVPQSAIYKSVDGGVTWTNEGNLPAGRFAAACFVYNNKMWIIGGSDGVTYHSTVYSSSDGTTWTNTGNIPGARGGIRGAVYNNKMWVSGGLDTGETARSDMFVSTDGVTWTTKALADSRVYHNMIAYDNKLWQIGGMYSGSYTADVRSCTDPCDSWTTHTSLPKAISNGMFFEVGGNLILVSGSGDSGNILSRDNTTGNWSAFSYLPHYIWFAAGWKW